LPHAERSPSGRHQSTGEEDLLRVAMNVECQTIKVPTGVQDYRPALYGGVAAIELKVEGIARVEIAIDPAELEQRIVLAYTGAPRNSGTNNWEITKRHLDGDREIFDCFERIRDTAAAMRVASKGRTGRSHGRLPRNGTTAASRTGSDDAGHRRAHEGRRSGGRHGWESVRRGRRRLPLLLRSSEGARGDGCRARARRSACARLPNRNGRAPGWITDLSRASWARSPICSR
jgi:hypothetical protein